jgi:hypothetical protein
MRIYKDNLNNGIGAESMTNQAKLVLNIRHAANDINEYGLLAYYNELADNVDPKPNSDYFTESLEKEMVKLLKLIYRYNNEVKELVK